MAYSVVPEPDAVRCADPCEHKDCAAWRAFFEAPCSLCGEPLQTGQTFCYPSRERIDAGHATEHGGDHFACVLERSR